MSVAVWFVALLAVAQLPGNTASAPHGVIADPPATVRRTPTSHARHPVDHGHHASSSSPPPEVCGPCAPPPQPNCRGRGPCGCGPYDCTLIAPRPPATGH